ncbi:MAG: extracellular solute-binding protein [Dehalococcoidia bacterium]
MVCRATTTPKSSSTTRTSSTRAGCPILSRTGRGTTSGPTRTLINREATIGALRYLRDLIWTDHATPPVEDLASSERIGSLFTAGQLGMAFGNHALVPLLASNLSLHWGVAGLPMGVKEANYAGGAGYVISNGSRQQQAAWTLLQWLVSAKGEAIFTESGLIVPSRRSVGHSNLFLHQGNPSGGAAATEVGNVFLTETEKGKGMPAFPGSTPITAAIDDGLTPIWSANADPGVVLNELAPKIDALLKARQ